MTLVGFTIRGLKPQSFSMATVREALATSFRKRGYGTIQAADIELDPCSTADCSQIQVSVRVTRRPSHVGLSVGRRASETGVPFDMSAFSSYLGSSGFLGDMGSELSVDSSTLAVGDVAVEAVAYIAPSPLPSTPPPSSPQNNLDDQVASGLNTGGGDRTGDITLTIGSTQITLPVWGWALCGSALCLAALGLLGLVIYCCRRRGRCGGGSRRRSSEPSAKATARRGLLNAESRRLNSRRLYDERNKSSGSLLKRQQTASGLSLYNPGVVSAGGRSSVRLVGQGSQLFSAELGGESESSLSSRVTTHPSSRATTEATQEERRGPSVGSLRRLSRDLLPAHRTPVTPVSPEGRPDYGGGGRGGLSALEKGFKRLSPAQLSPQSRDHKRYGPAVEPWATTTNFTSEDSGLDLQSVKSCRL